MNSFEKIVGIDLCEGISQLSCFDMEKMEPAAEQEIPALLLRKPDGSWLAGESAAEAEKAGEGVPVRGFLTDLDGSPDLMIGTESFSKADLIGEFLCRILEGDDDEARVYLTVTRGHSPS